MENQYEQELTTFAHNLEQGAGKLHIKRYCEGQCLHGGKCEVTEKPLQVYDSLGQAQMSFENLKADNCRFN